MASKVDHYETFRQMSKDKQREHLLIISALCIDGAPRSLARKIEIYLGATPEEQKQRLAKIDRL